MSDVELYKEIRRGRKEVRAAMATIEHRLDEISILLAALVIEGDDRTEAKALAAHVVERTKALRDSIPKV